MVQMFLTGWRPAIAAIGLLVLQAVAVPTGQAQNPDLVGNGRVVGDYPQPSRGPGAGEHFWLRGEYLYWQVTGEEALPLVTSSPLGTPLGEAGQLGLPTTTVVVGNEELNGSWQSGYAISGGYWLDSDGRLALVGDYFQICEDDYDATFGPNGGVIYARPFFNSELGEQDAQLVDVPLELLGSVRVQSRSEFLGAGLRLENIFCHCGNHCGVGHSRWLSVMGGYRFYQHNSLLQINEDLLVLPDTTAPLVPGTGIDLEDQFDARNQFHGGEIGFQGSVKQDIFWVSGLAAIAVGGNRREVSINGSTDITVPGGGSASSAGGLLTSSATNIGNYGDTKATAIPRFRMGVGCQLSQRISARLGYNVIIWDDVLQASSHLPPGLAVDPRNLPPVVPNAGPDPAFPGLVGTTVVAHGLDIGMELNY